ncbi:MAG TPA: hypothetical protein VMK12_13055 [Anaeromyxobacteraceae bacterium]|nr:hypothetical protein [Anaeromyxobacteraceae bacterium]
MSTHKAVSGVALFFVAGLTVAYAASANQGAATMQDQRHPDVEGSAETCASCHAEVTPAVAKAWTEGPHGLALVKCFVCHGSTGPDFRRHPDLASCAGCHAGEVRSTTLAPGRIQDCFACHPPHALLPAKGKWPHRNMQGGPP